MAQLIKTKHGWCFVGQNVDVRLWIVYNTHERAVADAEKYHVVFIEKV